MLESAVRILAISQQSEARTDGRPRIDLDVGKRTVVTLAALSMTLEEGTQWSGTLRWNVVTLPAVLVVAIDPPGKGWAYLGGALQLGSDPNETHIASTLCVASASPPASSTTATSLRSP